jgi:hypothetical protein
MCASWAPALPASRPPSGSSRREPSMLQWHLIAWRQYVEGLLRYLSSTLRLFLKREPVSFIGCMV